MSTLARVASFYRRNQLLIVCSGIVVGGHVMWRWLQNQQDIVRAREPMQYPWKEVLSQKVLVIILMLIMKSSFFYRSGAPTRKDLKARAKSKAKIE